jgi:hypothetical protein
MSVQFYAPKVEDINVCRYSFLLHTFFYIFNAFVFVWKMITQEKLPGILFISLTCVSKYFFLAFSNFM